MKLKERIIRKSEKLGRSLLHFIERRKQKDKRRVRIAKSIKLSKEQKKQINSFYKENLGKKINHKWHRLYTAISGKFDYRYFPELLYIPDYQRLSNDPDYYRGLQDKNILPLIIKGSGLSIKTAETLFSCSNGIILNKDNAVISMKEMIEQLCSIDTFFIKPSINSNSGQKCVLYKKEDKHDFESLLSLIKEYKKDYVIQEVLHNQDDIAKLNKTSLNSFRIITYIVDGVIYTSPIILRIGRDGKNCDNAHAGGLFVAVSDDGEIVSNGKTEFNDNYESHPDSNIKFNGYKIKNVDKVIKAAKEAASLVPHVGVIDWDFVLNENGDAVLLEGNMFGGSIWLIQMSHGKAVFGDNTARILQLIRKNKHLYS